MRLIAYHYNRDYVATPEGSLRHQRVGELLNQLQTAYRIEGFQIEAHHEAFPGDTSKQELLEILRVFAVKHHVGLAQLFGSRRRGFWYLPTQFLLVSEDGEMQDVLPCRIADQDVDVLGYLERQATGEAWTVQSAPFKGGREHKRLVERLWAILESGERGLRLLGTEVQVSRNFGELGYVDAVFQHGNGSYLLVEVKTTSTELDKAIGQILRHRDLFSRQNGIERNLLGVAIACPQIPRQYQEVCDKIGIKCYELEIGI